MLGGAPGIYSARYGAPDCVTDRDRLNYLLQNMRGVRSDERTARFVCVITLLYLIARGEDTNMIKRGGYALAEGMCRHLRDELRKNVLPTMERVRQLDELFIRRNLSPGGCADLLAVSYFLHDWKQQTQTE